MTSQTLKRLNTGLLVAVLVVVLVRISLQASSHGLHFDGYGTNGAFQLFNMLRRMADGQIPGRDFPVFHGVAIPLLHYLPFRALGQDLAASEIARFLVAPVLFGAAVFTYLKLATRLSAVTSAIVTLTLMIFADLLRIPDLVTPGNSLLGVRSAAALVVAGLLARMMSRSQEEEQGGGRLWRADVLGLGVFLALAILLGTERGAAAIIGSLLAAVAALLLRRRRDAQRIFLGVGIGIGFFVVILFGLSGPLFLESLRFAFVEIPKDQFWYFGVPPNPFNATLLDFLTDKPLLKRAGASLLALGLLFRWRDRAGKAAPELVPSLFLFADGFFGLVGYLGYAGLAYTEPLLRNVVLVAVTRFGSLEERIGDRRLHALTSAVLVVLFVAGAKQSGFLNRMEPPLALHYRPNLEATLKHYEGSRAAEELGRSVFGSGFSPMWQTELNVLAENFERRSENFRLNTDTLDKGWDRGIHNPEKDAPFLMVKLHAPDFRRLAHLVPGDRVEFNGGASREVLFVWKDYVTLDGPGLSRPKDTGNGEVKIIHRFGSDAAPECIWSFYSSLNEEFTGCFHPKMDYIIHALGPKLRKEYFESFVQNAPTYVRTMRRSYFAYEEWLQASHWDLYEHLLRNYVPWKVLPHVIYWKKTGAELPVQTVAEHPIGGAALDLKLPTIDHEQTLQMVTVRYEAKPSAWKFVPLLGKISRYFIVVEDALNIDPISLPPYRTEWSFPVVAKPGMKPRLRAEASALLGAAGLKIESVTVRTLKLPSETMALQREPILR